MILEPDQDTPYLPMVMSRRSESSGSTSTSMQHDGVPSISSLDHVSGMRLWSCPCMQRGAPRRRSSYGSTSTSRPTWRRAAPAATKMAAAPTPGHQKTKTRCAPDEEPTWNNASLDKVCRAFRRSLLRETRIAPSARRLAATAPRRAARPICVRHLAPAPWSVRDS